MFIIEKMAIKFSPAAGRWTKVALKGGLATCVNGPETTKEI